MIAVESENYSNIVPIGKGESNVLEGSTNFIIRLMTMFVIVKNDKLVARSINMQLGASLGWIIAWMNTMLSGS